MKAALQTSPLSSSRPDFEGLLVQCPVCKTAMRCVSADGMRADCDTCSFAMHQHNGIWQALPAGRLEHFAQFIRDYESIRNAEGRSSLSATYYLGLPYADYSGHNSAQWAIRARTYTYLSQRILEPLARSQGFRRILDIGAGNGWMSYRLAQLGLQPVAVDLLVNDEDGLGAARHYQDALPQMFPRFQAESTNLPFASEQFDCVIFNASFHYTEDYRRSVEEALRCMRVGGMLIIADSPWYAKDESGKQMVAERHALFADRFGTASDSIRSLDYLTDEHLRYLEAALDIRWKFHSPYYGIQWALRPLKAKLLGRREPSRFRIYCARKAA